MRRIWQARTEFVDYVEVDDDIAVQDNSIRWAGAGWPGRSLYIKIAGAAALAGCNLKKAIAQRTASSKSIGFAFTSCTVPAKERQHLISGRMRWSMVSAYMRTGNQTGKQQDADTVAVEKNGLAAFRRRLGYQNSLRKKLQSL